VFPGGSESGLTLKICMHMSKQNVSTLQIVGVGVRISSSYEQLDHFQLIDFMNK
jgi:hypothetical protein